MWRAWGGRRCFELKTDTCGSTCGITRDYSTSNVRFPPDAAPTTGQTGTAMSLKRMQSVCLSLALEPTFLSANAEFSQNPGLFGSKLPTMSAWTTACTACSRPSPS